MTQKTIGICLIVFVLTAALPGLGWAGERYRSSTFDNSYSRSWDEYKYQNNIPAAPVQRSWLANAIVKAVDYCRKFIFETLPNFYTSIKNAVREAFQPIEVSKPPESGYFKISEAGFVKDGFMSEPIYDSMRGQVLVLNEFKRLGADSDDMSVYDPLLYNHGNGAATVDMPLNWFKGDASDSNVIHDAVKVRAQKNRWEYCTKAAARDLAALVDSGKFKLIEVGGVNVKNGLGVEKINQILTRLIIPDNATVVMMHSAGTDAGARAMHLLSRNKDEVFWIFLSPRMMPRTLQAYVDKAAVKYDHVISINNKGDLPHWPNSGGVVKAVALTAIRSFNPMVPSAANNSSSPFKAYDTAPWTHVWLERGIADVNNKASRLRMKHGTMYDGMATNTRFVYTINGKRQQEMNNVSQIINQKLFKVRNERTAKEYY